MNAKTNTKSFLYRTAAVFMVAMMLLAAMPVASASATEIGFFSPTTARSNGPGWANSTNAFSSNDQYATAVRPHKALTLSNFNITAIQGGAIINGIEVTVEGYTLGLQAEVNLASVATGSTKGAAGIKTTTLGGSDTVITLGGPTDTWGKTWISSDFTNGNFSVKLVTTGTRGQTISLDQVRVKVYYTLGESTLTLNPVSGSYGGTTTMTATLTETDGGGAISGQTISFSLNGTSVGTATTDSAGVATLSGVSLVGINAGDYPYGAGASFAGGGGHDATSITADLRVFGTQTTLTVNPSSGAYTGASGTGTTNFSARLTETVSGNGVSNQMVTFYLGGASAGNGTTNGTGTVVITGASSLLAGYDAGVYNDEVTAEYAGSGGNEPSAGSAALTVSPVNLTVSGGLTPIDKVYDGDTNASLTIGAPTLNAGVISPDIVSLDASGAVGTFSDKNVGANKTVQISGLALTGLDAGNYSLTQPTRQASIAAKPLTITGLTANDKMYDGAITATLGGTATLSGVVSPDVVTLGGTPIANFGTANVGIGKSVTVTGYTISDSNYSLTQPTGLTANITPANQTISFGTLTVKVLGLDNPDFSVSATAGSGLTVDFSTITTSVCTVTVGGAAHLITIGTCTITARQSGNGNYNAAPDVSRSFNVVDKNVYASVAGSQKGSYLLAPGFSTRNSYSSVNNGPVRVYSINTVPIIDSIRVLFGGVSYSEMMGFPANQLTNNYWFPYYNNVAMNSQLRVSNVGASSTIITVTYGNDLPLDSYTLAAGATIRKNYAGINSGPLHVTSSASNILTTIRVLYDGLSYSELMGFPDNQLVKDYWYPYYNNVAMNSQLRVSNVGSSSTMITVTYGNNILLDSYTLAAGAATRKNYAGINSGPLHVTSSASNILTTIRVLYENQSFSELSGYPANQLTKEYVYPVYDNVTANSQLRVSNVGGAPTQITVYGANNAVIDSYILAAGAATRKNYSVNSGPLRVASSISNILSTQRLLYTTPSFGSFYELTGFPVNQLTTEYYFPWYNNTAMSSQLRIAVP